MTGTRVEIYKHVRCEVCGVPWHVHTPKDCSRHEYREVFMCRGFGLHLTPGDHWACCASPGWHEAGTSHHGGPCPVSCPCHGFQPPAPAAEPGGCAA